LINYGGKERIIGDNFIFIFFQWVLGDWGGLNDFNLFLRSGVLGRLGREEAMVSNGALYALAI